MGLKSGHYKRHRLSLTFVVVVLMILTLMSMTTFLVPTSNSNSKLNGMHQTVLAQVQMIPDSTWNWGAYLINATTVWSESTGAGVKVAVLDSGINPISGMKINEGYNYVNDNTDTTDTHIHKHGTMIASILATPHLTQNIVWGIAPDVEIYPIKVIDDTGAVKLEWAIKGVEWAIANHMQIISISWCVADNSNKELKQVLDKAYYEEGILIVAAAGNNGYPSGVECPAIYDPVIAVAAVNQNAQRSSTSAIGSKNELAAPGENVYGISPSNSLLRGDGTSFAVPYVVGTAALIWEKNHALTNSQVRDILCSTATDKSTPGRDTLYGYGIINATKAIQTVSNNNPPPPPPPPTTPEPEPELKPETETKETQSQTQSKTTTTTKQKQTVDPQEPPTTEPNLNNNNDVISPSGPSSTSSTNANIINVIIGVSVSSIITSIIFSIIRFNKIKKA